MLDIVINLLVKALEYLMARKSTPTHTCISCGHSYICVRERCPLIEALVCRQCEEHYHPLACSVPQSLFPEGIDHETGSGADA